MYWCVDYGENVESTNRIDRIDEVWKSILTFLLHTNQFLDRVIGHRLNVGIINLKIKTFYLVIVGPGGWIKSSTYLDDAKVQLQ